MKTLQVHLKLTIALHTKSIHAERSGLPTPSEPPYPQARKGRARTSDPTSRAGADVPPDRDPAVFLRRRARGAPRPSEHRLAPAPGLARRADHIRRQEEREAVRHPGGHADEHDDPYRAHEPRGVRELFTSSARSDGSRTLASTRRSWDSRAGRAIALGEYLLLYTRCKGQREFDFRDM